MYSIKASQLNLHPISMDSYLIGGNFPFVPFDCKFTENIRRLVMVHSFKDQIILLFYLILMAFPFIYFILFILLSPSVSRSLTLSLSHTYSRYFFFSLFLSVLFLCLLSTYSFLITG